jgi:hypothetical protein
MYGNSAPGAGGGSGAAYTSIVAVNPGDVLTVIVGAGGGSGAAAWINNTNGSYGGDGSYSGVIRNGNWVNLTYGGLGGYGGSHYGVANTPGGAAGNRAAGVGTLIYNGVAGTNGYVYSTTTTTGSGKTLTTTTTYTWVAGIGGAGSQYSGTGVAGQTPGLGGIGATQVGGPRNAATGTVYGAGGGGGGMNPSNNNPPMTGAPGQYGAVVIWW